MNSYEKQISEFKEEVTKAQEQAFDEMLAKRLPYLESDTGANVELRANDIVKKLLAGKYANAGDYLEVSQDGFLINIKVTNFQWDDFRKSLIELMPECPKDKEIEALKLELERFYKGNY